MTRISNQGSIIERQHLQKRDPTNILWFHSQTHGFHDFEQMFS